MFPETLHGDLPPIVKHLVDISLEILNDADSTGCEGMATVSFAPLAKLQTLLKQARDVEMGEDFQARMDESEDSEDSGDDEFIEPEAPEIFVGGGKLEDGTKVPVYCPKCIPPELDLGSSDMEIWEVGSAGWISSPVCSVCHATIEVEVLPFPARTANYSPKDCALKRIEHVLPISKLPLDVNGDPTESYPYSNKEKTVCHVVRAKVLGRMIANPHTKRLTSKMHMPKGRYIITKEAAPERDELELTWCVEGADPSFPTWAVTDLEMRRAIMAGVMRQEGDERSTFSVWGCMSVGVKFEACRANSHEEAIELSRARAESALHSIFAELRGDGIWNTQFDDGALCEFEVCDALEDGEPDHDAPSGYYQEGPDGYERVN